MHPRVGLGCTWGFLLSSINCAFAWFTQVTKKDLLIKEIIKDFHSNAAEVIDPKRQEKFSELQQTLEHDKALCKA